MTRPLVNRKPAECYDVRQILAICQDRLAIWEELPLDIPLDDVDHRLIELLRADGRIPAAKLASILGVSRGTVQNRIDRLLARGVLKGFTVRLRTDVDTHLIRALMLLEVRAPDLKTVTAQIKRFPEVARVWSTNGRWDLVAEIGTRDLAALDAVIAGIRTVRGVSHSETSILLTEL